MSSDLNAGYTATPNIPMEIKIDSPYYTNIINELKHDEKSSSFKRIKINHFPNEIMGRNINFESNLGDLEDYRKMNRGYTANNDRSNNVNENKNQYKPILINQNVNRFFNKNNINFSSEGESSSDCSASGEETVNPGRKTIRRIGKNSSMSNNSKPEASRKYTLQMRNNINFNTGKQEPNPVKRKLCCTCTKSRCLKKYCECFANNEFCDGCDCRNCHNLASFNTRKHPTDLNSNLNKANSEEKDEDQKDSEILCNCTKSNCTKKYCECFKAGEGCKELCRCLNCENDKKITRGHPTNQVTFSQDFPSINNSLYTEKRKANRNPMNYVLEGTSIYICNQDITVSFRKEILNKNKNKEKDIIKNHATDSDDDKIHECANAVDLITKVTSKSGSSDKKNNKLFDINTDSIISSNNNNDRDAYSYNSSLGREFNYNSANKNTTKANLETPNISRKRKRITKADSFTKSSSSQLHTPLFATTTTSTKKNNNKKMVNLDEQIIKKLDKIY